MEKKQNKSSKEITIPLFVPLVVITIFIILFINITNSDSTVIASSSENIAENNLEEKFEEDEKIINNSMSYENEEEVIDNSKESEVVQNTRSETQTAPNGEQYTVIGALNIPSLGIEYPILSSTSTALLKIALTKYWGAAPNAVGNMVVLGHNYNDNKFFSKLPNIEIGAIVKITDLSGRTLEYKVYDTYVIDPYDNTCTSQLTNGQTEITLITCYNNGRDRFVAKARKN